MSRKSIEDMRNHPPVRPGGVFGSFLRSKREQAIPYLVTMAQKVLHQSFGDAIERHGVSLAQWSAMVCLFEQDGLTQRELSDRVAVGGGTISRTIDRMERDGLVTRQPDEHDRRRVNVVLTEKSWGLFDTLIGEAMPVVERALTGVTDEEERIAAQVLSRIIANMTQKD
ncbi:MAG: MarR family transcriptional regulator [Alphaproteobacteria bacterium]|nr:MarR family transcriptional regulator [Alphaproteobacteria bacterium]